ncbi:MAG: hypothetical protein IJ519_01365 [Clostridia bacterium]|nr:hypothetical protein [Clostridia bacterium]
MIGEDIYTGEKIKLIEVIAVVLVFVLGLGAWHIIAAIYGDYSSTVGVIINGDDEAFINRSATNTVAALIQSDTFIRENITERLNDGASVSDVREKVVLKTNDEVAIINITVTADSAEEASELARLFYDADYSYVSQRLNGCFVSTYSRPSEPEQERVSVADYRGCLTGGAAALVAVVVIYFIRIRKYRSRFVTEGER